MSDDLRAAIEAWADSEPLIVHGIRRDMAQTPYGRGGELRFLPATSGHGMSGCPGDNLVAWLDDLRAILAAPAPDTDALAERALRATRFAESMALTERVRGRYDNERAWLDMLIILTPAQPAESTQSDAGEVGA